MLASFKLTFLSLCSDKQQINKKFILFSFMKLTFHSFICSNTRLFSLKSTQRQRYPEVVLVPLQQIIFLLKKIKNLKFPTSSTGNL